MVKMIIATNRINGDNFNMVLIWDSGQEVKLWTDPTKLPWKASMVDSICYIYIS